MSLYFVEKGDSLLKFLEPISWIMKRPFGDDIQLKKTFVRNRCLKSIVKLPFR